MKRTVASLLCSFAIGLAGHGLGAGWAYAQEVAEIQYLSEVDDLPLAPGLAEAGDAVVFDSDYGRVIRSRATGGNSALSVREFYAGTLPALGWHALGPSGDDGWAYEREYERLTIASQMGPEGLETAFELVISTASTRLE